MFFKIVGPKNFTIFTGKKPALESLFNNVASLQGCYFFKKRLQHRFFPVNSAKPLKTAFLQNTCGGCFCTTHYPSYKEKKIKSIFKYMYIF